MNTTNDDALSILIVEAGAPMLWEALDHSGEDCLILAQQVDETAYDFADRVHARLKRSMDRGRTLRRAVISVSPMWSHGAPESRARIVSTLAPRCPVITIDDKAPDSQAA